MNSKLTMSWRFFFCSVFALAFVSGCSNCSSTETLDAGPDGGSSISTPTDAGRAEDGGRPMLDAGPQCTPSTEGFGEPCAANEGDPLCGNWICNPQTDTLFCYDLGPNDCGACGELDTSAGRFGQGCGEFGCGAVTCNDAGSATICVNDHPRNQCGGCGEGIPEEYVVGEVCSQCQSGERVCTRDQDQMVCWRGRTELNKCGGCGRCVTHYAYMDERFGGGYLKNGTLAIIESVDNNIMQLVFDPLIEGPGANGLVQAQVMLSTSADASSGLLPLSPAFAQSISQTLADPVRSFYFAANTDPNLYTYVLVYDNFLRDVISAGVLVAGVPAGFDVSAPDLPPLPLDAGMTLNDAGIALGDAGSTLGDAGSTLGDAGSTSGDAGSTLGDAGSTLGDAGSTLGDAGSTSGDAGSILGDAGSILGDAGITSGDAGSASGDAGSASGDAGSASGDAGITSGDAG